MHELVPFSDLLSNIVDNRGRTAPVSDHGIPLIATNCIKMDALYPVLEKIRYVSEETYLIWFRGHPEPGDILFVTKGSPGRTSLVPDPVDFCIAQDMVAIRADQSKVYPKYLLAVLRSKMVLSAIEGLHVGTLIPHFKKGDFGRLSIPIPSPDVQRYIGDMYLDFSSKIELNRQMNQTLDELARTIFRSWFVDFDPVRAKSEGREPEGMDAETAALFPDRFVDSALGPIPEGWEVQPIGEMVTVVGGSTPSTKNPEFWEGGTHLWATPKDLSGLASPILIDTSRRVTDAGVQQISSRLLPVGSVLLSSRAPVGYLAITTEPTAINQGFIGMICDRGVPNAFVLNWARERMETIKGNAGGTTFAEISKAAFRPIQGVRPSEAVLDSFQRHTSGLYTLVEANLRESVTLVELRDTLLPELLSGRMRV